MENMAKNKWKVRGAVLMIFLLGFVAGALSLNAFHAWRMYNRSSGQNNFEKMLDNLQLTQEQRIQVKQIFDDTRSQLESHRKESEPKIHEIRKQADERLKKVLTPEQWNNFQKMKEEMHPPGGRGRPAKHSD